MKKRSWWEFARKSRRAAVVLGFGTLLGSALILSQTGEAAAPATDQKEAGTGAGDVAPVRTDAASVLSSTVIFLFAEEGGAPLGTAFIVGYPVPGKPDKFVPLIVTAKHVLAGRMTVVGRFTGKPGVQPVSVPYDLTALRKSGDLWEHSDEDVDILVFRTPSFPQTEYTPVPLNLVASRELFAQEDVKATDRVVFPSLLTNFPGTNRNYPVVRDGSIALIPEEPVILINAMSIPGASGAPVFLWPGPRLKAGRFAIGGTQPLLLGIMEAYVNSWPQVLVQVEPNASIPVFTANSGIAVAIPSWRLLEILQRDDVGKRILEVTAKGE